MRIAKLLLAILGATVLTVSLREQTRGQDQIGPNAAYLPKLGDIMGQTQLRHFKLWFAGSLKNWELASYEVAQIRDSFDTAAKLYPTLGDVAFAQLIKSESEPPLADISKAIAAKSSADFDKAFGQLTMACNSCHSAAHVSFIRIRVPTSSPFSNQVFPPQQK